MTAPQIITFGLLADRTYGDVDFTLSATGGASGLPVTFVSSDPTIASVTEVAPGVWNVHINAVGTVTITASQAGNATYAPADDVPQDLTIHKAASFTTTASSSSSCRWKTWEVTGRDAWGWRRWRRERPTPWP